jgi:hypothetical protein
LLDKTVLNSIRMETGRLIPNVTRDA